MNSNHNEPWPKHRILELYRNAANSMPDFITLNQMFSRLPLVETLSVFSARCPWVESDTYFGDFWRDEVLNHEPSEQPFGHRYQDRMAAYIQYAAILVSIQHLDSPLRRLRLDSVPLEAFQYLCPGLADDIDGEEISQTLKTADVVSSLTAVRDLHMVIVVDSLSSVSTLKRSSSALSQFLGSMNLHNLSLVWSDMKGDLNPSWEPQYLRAWSIWHAALLENTWPNLEIVRSQDFRAPDKLLLRFLLRHASSLRRVALIGCFVGYSVFCPDISKSGAWGSSHSMDNYREFLESLKGQMRLEELRVCFNSQSGEQVIQYTRLFGITVLMGGNGLGV
jgi:hypothetical protein